MFRLSILLTYVLLPLLLPFAPTSQTRAQDDAADSNAQNTLPAEIETYRPTASERWEQTILKLEKQDKSETHPNNSVLFVGSSSIRFWHSITEDVAPYHPIQRGFGGARFSDLAVFAERLITPHQYRAIVVFVANDIRGREGDRTPDQVEPLVRHIIAVSRKHQPQAPVLIIEITPTSKRFAVWKEIRGLNARLREIALSTPHTYFIPTAGHFLTPTGTPRDELFVNDLMHLNREGYRLWSTLIRRRLDEVLRLEKQKGRQQAQPQTEATKNSQTKSQPPQPIE